MIYYESQEIVFKLVPFCHQKKVFIRYCGLTTELKHLFTGIIRKALFRILRKKLALLNIDDSVSTLARLLDKNFPLAFP